MEPSVRLRIPTGISKEHVGQGMAKEWAPSWLGQHLTGSSDWRLRLEGLELALTLEGRTHRVNVEDEATYRVHTGTFWTDITFRTGRG